MKKEKSFCRKFPVRYFNFVLRHEPFYLQILPIGIISAYTPDKFPCRFFCGKYKSPEYFFLLFILQFCQKIFFLRCGYTQKYLFCYTGDFFHVDPESLALSYCDSDFTKTMGYGTGKALRPAWDSIMIPFERRKGPCLKQQSSCQNTCGPAFFCSRYSAGVFRRQQFSCRQGRDYRFCCHCLKSSSFAGL